MTEVEIRLGVDPVAAGGLLRVDFSAVRIQHADACVLGLAVGRLREGVGLVRGKSRARGDNVLHTLHVVATAVEQAQGHGTALREIPRRGEGPLVGPGAGAARAAGSLYSIAGPIKR